MNKIDHYIALNKTGNRLLGGFEDILRKNFAGDKRMLNAIEVTKKDNEAFDYEKISEQPDEQRAIRIVRHENQLEMLYEEDVTELLVRVCKLPHASAKDIVKSHYFRF